MKSRTDWDKLNKIKDSSLDYSDIPATGGSFWDDASTVKPKKTVDVTLKLDADLAEWLLSLGGKSDSFLNSVLRAYYVLSSEK